MTTTPPHPASNARFLATLTTATELLDRIATVEALRSRRAQLSAWQTAMTAERAEAEFARTGPRSTP